MPNEVCRLWDGLHLTHIDLVYPLLPTPKGQSKPNWLVSLRSRLIFTCLEMLADMNTDFYQRQFLHFIYCGIN